MKNLKSILVVTTILTLSILVLSSFSFGNEATAIKYGADHFNKALNNSSVTVNNTLNGDVWFAFATIAVLGTYLGFKK